MGAVLFLGGWDSPFPFVPFTWIPGLLWFVLKICFLLFVFMVLCGTVVLDMGQYWGWFTSPFFVPWFVAFALLASGFVFWGLRAPAPLIDLRPFGERNFGVGLTIKALFSANLSVLLSLLSAYMIGARGYQWWQGALVILPALATWRGRFDTRRVGRNRRRHPRHPLRHSQRSRTIGQTTEGFVGRLLDQQTVIERQNRGATRRHPRKLGRTSPCADIESVLDSGTCVVWEAP